MWDLEYLSSISHMTDSILGNEGQAKGFSRRHLWEGHDVQDAIIAHPTRQDKVFTQGREMRPNDAVVADTDINRRLKVSCDAPA
jgi:hypothetical protein